MNLTRTRLTIQVDEFPAVAAKDVSLAMEALKDTPTTLMFHAEMIPPITDSVGDSVQISEPPLAPHGKLTSYQTFLESRPPAFETYAIEEILALSSIAPNLNLHVVHLSATECIPILKAARKNGVKITAETCFHYLGLTAEQIQDGDTRHKCCPPIRGESNNRDLWDELTDPDSCIRTVVSDHSPCTPELKILPAHLAQPPAAFHHSDSGVDVTSHDPSPTPPKPHPNTGDFFAAWGGISSVGLGLPILHTTSARMGNDKPLLSLTDIVRLCAQATAAQVGLSHRKGGLKVGMDGDVCVFDDRMAWTLEKPDMMWKNKCSPWDGREFVGRVKETWVRGRRVFALDEGGVLGGAVGEPILEKRVC